MEFQMRVTEQNLAERKKRLIYTAYDLFVEYGIDEVTLSQISKKSKISLNSIYCYFDSKATLVRHTQKILWGEILEHMLSGSKDRVAAAQNGLEEIKILLLDFKSFYENHSRYLLFAYDYKLFLFRNHLKLSKELYDEIITPVYNAFGSALERGQLDGSITKSETVKTQFFALWGIMRGFVEQIVIFGEIYEGNNPWKESFDLVLTHTIEGLKNKE